MKLLRKYIAIVLLTLVLTVAGLHLASRILTPKGEIEKFYDEPRNTVDVLLVGSSHSMSGLSPVQLYRQTGLTAYNLSTWSQPVWVSYHYIREALKYQTPQVVVLDVFGAFYDRSYLTGVDVDLVSDDFAAQLRPSWNLLELNLARRRAQVTRKTWDEYLNITKYHSRLNRLEWEDIAVVFGDDCSTGKGYGPMYTTEDFSPYTPMQSDHREALYPFAEEYLQKIIELSRQKDFRLVFVKVPYIMEEVDAGLLNTVRDLCDAQGIPFVDCCGSNLAGLDYSRDMADHGHVNYRGAYKVTSVLAEYLNGLALPAQHTPQVTASWQHTLAVETAGLQRMDIRSTADFDEKMEKIAAYGDTVAAIVVQDPLTAADETQLKELLEGTVLEPCAKQLAPGMCVVYAQELLEGTDAARRLTEYGIQLRQDEAGSTRPVFEDKDCSYGMTGLTLLLFDAQTGELYQAAAFGREYDYRQYTG